MSRKQIIERDIEETAERQEALEPAVPSKAGPEKQEAADSSKPKLLLMNGNNAAACTAEGCAVSFGSEK